MSFVSLIEHGLQHGIQRYQKVFMRHPLEVGDGITLLLSIWIFLWTTECWGWWTPKPDPLLFVPVKDPTEFENRPKKSRNVVDALKVSIFRSLQVLMLIV